MVLLVPSWICQSWQL